METNRLEAFSDGVIAVIITILVLAIAPLLALGVLYRERDAQARHQQLEFALEKSQLERQALDAQLKLLHAQIEPHFLFNALNTIASTIHTDPNLADALLTKLAALLRAATELARQPETTLDEELRLLEAYAAIMRQRFAERVDVRFDIDDSARPCRVPTLLLQPLSPASIIRIYTRTPKDSDKIKGMQPHLTAQTEHRTREATIHATPFIV